MNLKGVQKRDGKLLWDTMADFFYETLQKKDSKGCMFIV